MQMLFDILRHHPEIALFLTLAIGFWVGSLKFGSFSLGMVSSTLIAALLVGQLGITMPGFMQQTFFLSFLFAIGYSVGPQFFASLKKEALPQGRVHADNVRERDPHSMGNREADGIRARAGRRAAFRRLHQFWDARRRGVQRAEDPARRSRQGLQGARSQNGEAQRGGGRTGISAGRRAHLPARERLPRRSYAA